MRFDVLGPLVVTGTDGRVVLPVGPSTAAVCWLVANAGEPVSHAGLAAVLWPDAPDAARAAAVLRLVRPRLESVLSLGTEQATLRVGSDDVDETRFRRLVALGGSHRSEGRVAEARLAYEQALGLWRSEPYPELAAALPAMPVIGGLLELREEAVEELFGLRLQGPVDYRLVADLRSETTRAPERPRLQRQLALALYRTGRQVEALSLVGALRAEADASAAEVYDAMLRHDPSLEHGEPAGS